MVGNRLKCTQDISLSEDRPCNTHECGRPSLSIGTWSTCYALDPLKKCGQGVQWRNISCFRINGVEAPLDYCIEELYGGKMALKFQVNIFRIFVRGLKR